MKHALLVSLGLLLFALPVLGDTIHVVQKGETLYSIARKYGLTLDTLLKDNGIAPENAGKINAGTRLTIRGASAAATSAPQVTPTAQVTPTPQPTTTYTVARNDTLWAISRRYGIQLAELLALNPGVSAEKLYPGVKLKVPAPPKPAAASPASTASGGTQPASTASGAAGSSGSTASAASATGTPRPATTASSDASLWPYPGPRTVSTDSHVPFIKIAGKAGDPVTAVASGTVRYVAPYRGYRNVVIIEAQALTGRGVYQFWYAGIDDVYVRAGDWVEKGATIARVGVDGIDGKAQVSFVVFQGQKVVDHTALDWQ